MAIVATCAARVLAGDEGAVSLKSTGATSSNTLNTATVAPSQKLHVACGQIVCHPGDIDGNLRQIRKLASEAADAGAKLVLFAEGALTGYVFTPEFLQAHAVSVDSAPMRSLQALSRERNIVIAVGAIEQAKDGRYVSHFVLFPDRRVLIQRKNFLTATELGAGIVRGPEERLLFDVDGVRLAIMICSDSAIPDIWNKLAARGCQVWVGPAAGGAGREHLRKKEDIDDPELRKKYLHDMEQVCYTGTLLLDCRDHRMALITVNMAGDDGIDHYHPGHSIIVDSRGWLVALRPGEYIAEYLAPQMIHGEILVQTPRPVMKP